MKYLLTSVLLISICVTICSAKDKSEKKEKDAIDKEEIRFRKNQAKDPYNAELYWTHANNLAAFNSEYARAQEFYKKAIFLDSANATIYKDYGRYLYERIHAFDDAKLILAKSLQYNAEDAEVKKYIETVDIAIANREGERKLRDYGTTNLRELNQAGNYASMANFDSLKKILTAAGNDKSYQKLLSRYLADDSTITPAEMYLLIIGYSASEDYNPFNYNEILAMKQVAVYNIDSGINRGLELINSNPLNPSINRELMYYYRKKNDNVTAEKYKIRVRRYFDGMLYSGNGTCERPYLSLWSKEHNNFLNYLGYQPTDSHAMATCAGQMAEIADVTDPVSGKTANICFNLKLIYLQTTRK